MVIRFYFKDVKKADKEQLENYFKDKKLSRLTHLLQHGNLGLAKFVVNVKYHQRHNVFIVRLGLKVIKNDLNAEEKGKNLLEVFDIALDDIIIQLRKLESLKHDK